MSQAGSKAFSIAPGTYVQQINGDTGSATGAIITFNAASNAGSTVEFSASGSIVDLLVTDTNDNTVIGLSTSKPSGQFNTGLGYFAFHSAINGNNNTAIGYNALNHCNNSYNTAIGAASLFNCSLGTFNTAIGAQAGGSISSGSYNTAIGYLALDSGTLTNNYNIAIGYNSGSNYISTEASNIIIGSQVSGTVGESNTLHIGDTGASALVASYIGGIHGVIPSGVTQAVIINSSGQLGSQAFPASSISITGNSGGALTGNAFTFTGGTTGLTFAGAGTTETLGGTLAIANGGTNATSMSTSTGIVKYDGTSLVTSSAAKIDSSNRQTNTAQPAFLYWASTVSNVTGNGTGYIILFNNLVFDQNSNFNGATGVFTAPVTGKYEFSVQIALSGITSSHTAAFFQIVTTSAGYLFNNCNPFNLSNSGQAGFSGSILVAMTAGDTMHVSVQVSNGTQVVGIIGTSSSDIRTSLSGSLVC